jgi:hypothetical protein
LDRSEETILIGWNITPQTGHFEPFMVAAFVALSANDCCFAILLPVPFSQEKSKNLYQIAAVLNRLA